MQQGFANKQSFDTYILYLALKRHFSTPSYDFHKYNGKVKASFEKFSTRADAFYFQKLSDEPRKMELILSNMIKNPNIWVRDLFEDAAQEVYRNWKKRIDSLTYTFQQDLKLLHEDYKSNYVVEDNDHPHLMKLYMQKKITLESFTILTNISNVFPYWRSEISDKFIAKDMMNLAEKYFTFLEIDTIKYKKIVKDAFFSKEGV